VIYSDIQRYTVIYSDIQRYTAINSDIQRYTAIYSDIQPSTAPLITLMQDQKIKVQNKQQNFINILTNRRINNNVFVVQVIQKS
jgi:hypothetical protein